MGRYIPEHIIEEIRDKADMLAAIGSYVKLQRRGRNYVGLCPFHNEDTPSFTVSPDKQMWHCFGCGEGGNIFTFLTKQENITFPEAVARLAEETGVSIPEQEQQGQDSEEYRARQLLYEINKTAARWFFQCLRDTPEAETARRYLLDRGVSERMQARFGLGYAPDSWDALHSYLQSQGYTSKDCVRAGLLSSKKDRFFDRFRGRVMFPILDTQGRVVGFGGRLLGDGEPKYLNSPETQVFLKSRTLYGMNWAGKEVRRLDRVVVVEGYMDVITAHQFGVTNTVASLGTAFTAEQGRLLLRFSKNVFIAYDPDTAGAKATLRGLDILHALGANVKVIQLPQGMDPDDYLRRKGREAFEKLAGQEALSLVEYKLNNALAQYGSDTVEGKVSIVQSLLPDLSRLSSAVEQEEYIRLVAARLDLSEDAVQRELSIHQRNTEKSGLKRTKIGKNRHNDNVGAAGGLSVRTGLERQLLHHCLQEPQQAKVVNRVLELDKFQDAGVREILKLLYQHPLRDGEAPAALTDRLSEAGQKVLAQVTVTDAQRLDKFEHLLNKLHLFQVEGTLELLEGELKHLQDTGNFRDFLKFLAKSTTLWQENDFLRRINIRRN